MTATTPYLSKPPSSEPRGTFACVRALGEGGLITPQEARLLVASHLACRHRVGQPVRLTRKGLDLLATLQAAEARSHELRARAKAETRRAFVRTLPYRDSSVGAGT